MEITKHTIYDVLLTVDEMEILKNKAIEKYHWMNISNAIEEYIKFNIHYSLTTNSINDISITITGWTKLKITIDNTINISPLVNKAIQNLFTADV